MSKFKTFNVTSVAFEIKIREKTCQIAVLHRYVFPQTLYCGHVIKSFVFMGYNSQRAREFQGLSILKRARKTTLIGQF